jgi:CheY-like chemotaxis protein
MEKKILIIDDDRFYMQYLGLMLPKYFPEHKILKAENGTEAWQLLRAHEWSKEDDFIILDLQMPNLNGFGLLRMIRKHDDMARKCPRILINSNFKFPGREPIFQGLELDYAVFAKPLHLSKVRQYMDAF